MDKLDEIMKIIEIRNGICLSREKFQPIYEQLIPCKKDKNELISQIGDIDKKLSILIDGIIRLYYIDLDGNDITRYFGERGCISGGSSDSLPYAVETLVPSEFLTADWDNIKSILRNDIYWIRIWNQLLQNSIRYKIYRESCFLMKSATERYIDFRRMHPELEEQVSQAHIASYLGITPVSLSRIRRTIRDER